MPSGPVDLASNAAIAAKFVYDLDAGNVADAINDATSMIGGMVNHFLVAWSDKKEIKNRKGKGWIYMPSLLPSVDIPFTIRTSPDPILSCSCLTNYGVVLYNTQSGKLVYEEHDNSVDMHEAFGHYIAKLDEVIRELGIIKESALIEPGYERIDRNETFPVVNECYSRVPRGTEKGRRLVTINSENMITFGDVASMGHVTAIWQTLKGRRATVLDGATGTWKHYLKQMKIKYKLGDTPMTIYATLTDFLGTWCCATGDASTLGKASHGTIANDVKYSNTFGSHTLRCSCYSSSPPNFYYCIGSKYDLVGGWE